MSIKYCLYYGSYINDIRRRAPIAQHFLLSAARTLSLKAIMCMSDDEAHARFVVIRWTDNGSEALFSRCRCTAVYTYTARRIRLGSHGKVV